MKLIKTSHIVKRILENVPECRDDDTLLTLKVWSIEEPELRKDKTFSFWKFAKRFRDGDFSKTESIRRSRCKIQEECPELRGEKYKARMEHQDDVIDELHQMKYDLKKGTKNH